MTAPGPTPGPAAGERRFEVRADSTLRSDLPGPGPLRWGVLGATSTVARHAVMPAMMASPKAELVAVASLRGTDPIGRGGRKDPKRKARVHRSYESLLEDPEVEAVYVPLPNHLHRPWTERAAEAGKHVLCEKPLAPTAADASAMADACRVAGVVLAEAYMTPFHPRARAFTDEIGRGRLGSLRTASCGFTFPLRDPLNHRWDPECGGGALLDVGVYCLAPLIEIAGAQPERVVATATMTPSGVDATFAAFLEFSEGFSAHVCCSFEMAERQLMVVAGTQGSVGLDRAFTAGPEDTGFVVEGIDGALRPVQTGGADPYRGMIDHFGTVVRGGADLRRPPRTSIAVLTLIDRLRRAAADGRDPGVER